MSTARLDRHVAAALGAVLAVSAGVGTASAAVRERFSVTGLQTLEAWDTDDGSRLLSRNEGDPVGLAELRLWAVGELLPGFQAVAQGELADTTAEDDGSAETELDLAFLRYTTRGRTPVRIEAGKLVVPFGDFTRRYLPNVNPLIGAPDSYDVSYPHGLTVAGRAAWFDFRGAAFDLPLINEKYVPEGDRAWRPGFGVGFTPTTGLRFGAYWTKGPYLGSDIEWAVPAGQGWKEFEQEIVGMEFEFSRGHFELHGDLAFSSYDVPTASAVSRGQAWFIEPKYTWTPRLFTALRFEYNDYPYIRPVSDTFWIHSNAAFHDVEVGAGWRFTPNFALKGSYRVDRWDVEESLKEMLPDGHAFALQLNYEFDLLGWFDQPR